jgi:hypothetical protein
MTGVVQGAVELERDVDLRFALIDVDDINEAGRPLRLQMRLPNAPHLRTGQTGCERDECARCE